MKRESMVKWLSQIRGIVRDVHIGSERLWARVDGKPGEVSEEEMVFRLVDLENECRHVLGSSRKLRKVIEGGIRKSDIAHA